jgi:hypothetical protein
MGRLRPPCTIFEPILRWTRFAGPGPLAAADIENNGILSVAIKVMGVEGEKLLDEERMTQDFTGISAPTFTTPNIIENLKLMRAKRKGDQHDR